MNPLAAIAGWLVLAALGIIVLAWGAWRLSTHARKSPTDDAAPRTHLPSLHELRARRDRR